MAHSRALLAASDAASEKAESAADAREAAVHMVRALGCARASVEWLHRAGELL